MITHKCGNSSWPRSGRSALPVGLPTGYHLSAVAFRPGGATADRRRHQRCRPFRAGQRLSMRHRWASPPAERWHPSGTRRPALAIARVVLGRFALGRFALGREAVAALCRRACPPDCRHTTPSAAKRSQTAVAPSGLVSLKKRTSPVGKPTGRALASLRDAKTAATPARPSGMRAAVSCRTRRDKAVQRPASPAQRINTHRDKST